jgi:hypothetical protein
MTKPKRLRDRKADADHHLSANHWHLKNVTAGERVVGRGGSHCIAHLSVPDDGRLRHLYDLHVGEEGYRLGRG